MIEEMMIVTFALDKPSPLEVYSEISGMRVEVKENNSQVIVRMVQAASTDEALKKASSAANQFLDSLSWRFSAHLAIKGESYSVELVAPSGQKQVFVHPEPASAVPDSRGPTVVTKDASGNTIEISDSRKPGKIDVTPSEAASYYRRAHLTKDPFDSFRNLYLATENVADKIRIDKGYLKKHELKKIYGLGSYEVSLLRLALDQRFANDQRPLMQAAKHIQTFDDKQPVIPQVSKILYEARCQLGHSKASKDKKVPFTQQDEEEVKAALPLMDFVAKSLLEYEQTSLLK
jgi:hypothetical protein